MLVFQNHEFKIFSAFKLLALQNPEFNIFDDFNI